MVSDRDVMWRPYVPCFSPYGYFMWLRNGIFNIRGQRKHAEIKEFEPIPMEGLYIVEYDGLLIGVNASLVAAMKDGEIYRSSLI